jgi:hypothetical protein
MALRQCETLNPDRLKYQMIFVDGSEVDHRDTALAREFTNEPTL